jgi:ectoine hydroxylase-related dioxygenase (phytanoyl-CoA dioxygenase family)
VFTAAQKYLFDVSGFIVIENILDDDLLSQLNSAFDERRTAIHEGLYSLASDSAMFTGDHPRSEFDEPFNWPQPWASAFRRLVSLPRAIEIVREVVGDGLRYDSMKGTLMEPGTEGFALHGGAGNPESLSFYRVVSGAIRNGLVNMAYALNDVGPGDGGFVCLPGSHKASFRLPNEIRMLQEGAEHVRQVSLKAGSAVLFSEALIHGTLPWRGAQERRTIFVRYSAAALCFRREPMPRDYDSFKDDLTELQRAIFEPPYQGGRPDIAALMAEESG